MTLAINTLNVEHERFEDGLTLDEFVDGIDTYQEETRRRLRDVRLADADVAAFARLAAPLHVLVLTEGWCGDSLFNLPILARIVEATPGADLRVFVRSQEPELTAAYQERGIRNIPVFTFFDGEFNEIGTWVERSQAAHERMAQWRRDNPDYDAIRNDPTLSQEEKHARLRPVVEPLRAQMEQWYAEQLQAATVAELRALLGVGAA
jgi:hypothetical protein